MCPWSTVSLPRRTAVKLPNAKCFSSKWVCFCVKYHLASEISTKIPIYIYDILRFEAYAPQSWGSCCQVQYITPGFIISLEWDCKIHKCHWQAPRPSWYKQCTGWGHLGWMGCWAGARLKLITWLTRACNLSMFLQGLLFLKFLFSPQLSLCPPLFLPQLSLCHKFSLQLYVHKDNFSMNRLWSLFYWGQKNKKLHCRRKDLDKTYRYGFVVVTLFFSRKYLKWVMSAIPNGFGSILSEVKEKCFLMIFKKSFMWFQT